MSAPVPVYVYGYEVTDSTVSTVPVGTLLVDKRRQRQHTWDLIDMKTGAFTQFTAVRLERRCSECYVLHRLVRDYGHDGEHGERAAYTPPVGSAVPGKVLNGGSTPNPTEATGSNAPSGESS